MRQLLYAVVSIFLLGCSQQNLLQKFSSPEDQAVAKGYIDLLRKREFDAIETWVDPSLKSPALHATLEKMSGFIPGKEPISVMLVGAHSFHTTGATTIDTTFEYNYGEKWILANVALKDKDGTKTIVAFNVIPEARSLEDQNRFTLSNKPRLLYFMLGAALLAAILTFFSLFICIRTKIPRRKWLWILFILFGFGKFAVNWNTGQWSVLPASIQLFSASAVAQFYGPWIISFSIPVGALFFLIYRRKYM